MDTKLAVMVTDARISAASNPVKKTLRMKTKSAANISHDSDCMCHLCLPGSVDPNERAYEIRVMQWAHRNGINGFSISDLKIAFEDARTMEI